MLLRRKQIRERAQGLLEQGSIKKAPVDVEKLAERLGIRIVEERADDNQSGFLIRDTQKKIAIIGVNKAHHENRRRFTIAHEIGHFLLHRGEKLHLDKEWSGYQVSLRDDKSSTGTNVDEMEANLFAAELLMPVSLLGDDLAKSGPLNLDDDKISALAKKYKVSAQAFTLRLTYLGFIRQ